MNTVARLVPFGTLETLAADTWAAAKKAIRDGNLKGDERQLFNRAVRGRVRREYAHLCEVYLLLFGANTEKVIAVNRQYEPVAKLSWDQAFALMEERETKVTATWAAYGVGPYKGDGVWIAHADSLREDDLSNQAADLNFIREIQGRLS